MNLTSQRIAAFLGTSLIAACGGVDDSPEVAEYDAPLIQAEAGARIPGRYIVTFDGKTSSARANATAQIAAARDGSRVLYSYSVIPALAAELSAEQLRALRRDPSVQAIEEDQQVTLDTAYVSQADGLDRVDQTRGHDAFYDDHFRTGYGVHIYIIDTGIYAAHNEFTGRVGAGHDFVDNDGDPADCHGHGTHVSSTAAGWSYGIAKEATLHGVRVLDCTGRGAFSTVIAGVDFVANDCPAQGGPCVANMSLSGGNSTALKTAVAAAVGSGVPFAVAAGNDATDACTRSPANAPSAMTVGAIDDNDQRAWFSNFGSCVDLFAPGVTIRGASIGSPNAFAILDGTSMASPHLAGVIAQYLESNPGAPPSAVEASLEAYAHLNCVGDEHGAPDLLLYNDFDAVALNGRFDCTAPEVIDSCVGFCGGLSDDGCYCDATCAMFGDCCPDKLDVCGEL